VFCPWCGVKNDPGEPQCFVCKKGLPSPDAERLPPRPRQVTLAVAADVPGSIGDRMLALLFDRLLLLSLLAIPASLIASYWSQVSPRISSILWRSITASAVLVIAIFLYHFGFEGAFGSTLGKAIFGLRIRSEGERSRLAAAAIRNAARLIDSLVLYLIGFLVAFFSPRNQRLGDHMAKTVVVVVPGHWAARAGLLLVWLALIGGSLWYSGYLCPACLPSLPALRPLHL
jgi:uncharacterized RDD family membrane protein YckC